MIRTRSTAPTSALNRVRSLMRARPTAIAVTVALSAFGLSFGLAPSAQASPPQACGTSTPALFSTLSCSTAGTSTVTVPVGTTSVGTDVVGGGGGAGYPVQPYVGGNAAEVQGTLMLPTGTAFLVVIVGAGGQGGTNDISYGGNGSGVFALDSSHALIAKLAIAGAGGGGAYNGDGGNAGAAGTSDNAAAAGGQPGSGATGGAGGLALGDILDGQQIDGIAGQNDNPTAQSLARGGAGAVQYGAAGGSGGGGYAGGGGGAWGSFNDGDRAQAGGGGGSSFASTYLTSPSTTVKAGTGGVNLSYEIAGPGATGSVTLTFDGVTVPGAPTGATAVAGNTQATVSFTAPVDNGGSTITGYTVTSSPGGITNTCATSPCAVTGLTNGTSYTFTVHATNVSGNSVESSPTSTVTPAVAPGAPTSPTATPAAGQASVAFTAPVSNGGSAIISYTAISIPGGFTNTCATSPCVVTGLTNGTSYTFTVHATNAIGNSVESAASAAVVPLSVPGAPTGVVASAGDGMASVAFVAPTNTGGTPIIEYTVIAEPGDEENTCSTSPCGVSGLDNGTTYTITVYATNSVGNSVESTSTTVTPAAAPGAPTGATATVSTGAASVSFIAPVGNGGSAIISYTVISIPGGFTNTCSASPCAVTGLTNGTSYTFTVHATNAVGSSVESAATSAVTPIGSPAAPSFTVSAGDGTAMVSITAPTDTGGSPITGYEYTTDSGTSWHALTTTGTAPVLATITGLDNGTAYFVNIRAVNTVGVGAASASQSVTPATTPGTPVEVTAFAGDGQANVSIIASDFTGGAAVTGYTVTSAPGGFTASCATSPCTVTGLTNGVSYTFTAHATNAMGNSVESGFSNAVVPAGAPGIPSNVSGTSTATSITVSFTAPDDNGNPIIQYEYQYVGGDHWTTITPTGTSPNLTITITGLTPGTAYPVMLRAANEIATGEASDPVTITTRPTTLAAPTATPGVSSATVSWPQSPDSTVTGYTVTAEPGPATCVTTTITDTSCVIGTTAGVTYTYTVVANSPAGDSAGSATSNAVGGAAPAVPTTAPLDAATTLTTTDGVLAQVEPSQQITVIGSGFLPYSTVTIIIYSAPIVLATVTTNSIGSFSQPVTLPASLAAGLHNLVASGVDPNGAIHLIRMPVTYSVVAIASALPNTGAPAFQLTILATVLATTGLLLITVGRRRRPTEL